MSCPLFSRYAPNSFTLSQVTLRDGGGHIILTDRHGRRHRGMGGYVSPGSEFRRDVHPEIAFFERKISEYIPKILDFFSISKIKWAKSEEKSEFWGR